MNASRCDLLRRQFDLTWSLFEYHLERLDTEDFLWQPAPLCWTVHLRADGRWTPDWAETEPDPVPVPTIGWLSWHIGWWWSTTVDHSLGRKPRDREDVAWPGDAEGAIGWLRELREEWLGVLDGLDDAALDAAAPSSPWEQGPDHTVAHMAAWVNAELMKNVAEIGQLRMVRAASSG
ncbi:DinB family protein [Streptomyces sp. rh34]|uniref:DinB family protein n=1 Tax=Streptomyces sp. rh34 TaxID=2034272 RepID=UPI000BF03431|nr:DinB family protein [Streptomyces sp. rh34]